MPETPQPPTQHVKPNPLSTILFRIAAVLWVIWGLVHTLAGILTIAQPTAKAAANIADAVDPAVFELPYPDAMGAILNQHGFNLLWAGVVTTLAAVFIWRRSIPAVALAALVGGLLDIGYFLFLDLGGHVHFVPGTLMTLICAAAIILSTIAALHQRKANPAAPH
ncbi:MAG: hypothetical protein AAF078_10890 [Planctomycetota bacterium]